MPRHSIYFDSRPDFVGFSTFRTEHGTVEKIESGFFLPKSEVAKTWVIMRVASHSSRPIFLGWRFSCELAVGSDVLIGEEIFHSGYTEWDWGNGVEDTLVGEITRLAVNHGDVRNSAISKARFVITPSALLRSADLLSENGELVVRQVIRKGPLCLVNPNIAFRFGSAYRRGTNSNIELSVECELIEPKEMRDPNRILHLLHDVLAVASLAERRVLMATGWTVLYANGATTTYFRRNFTASLEEKTDIDNTLIPPLDIEEFLNVSLEQFGRLPDSNALKQAIYFALHGQDRGIGDAYVMLFAGIETLLNVFQPSKDVDPPAPNDIWQALFDTVSTVLERQRTFIALPDRVQEQLLKNIRGANQVSFSNRFERMCSSQKIDLADLWPMLGGGNSLYAVRNRIVHGRVFSSDQEWFRVVSAKFHLLWTLERSILSILGWPVGRSRCSARSLSGMTLYSKWRADREYFTTAK